METHILERRPSSNLPQRPAIDSTLHSGPKCPATLDPLGTERHLIAASPAEVEGLAINPGSIRGGVPVTVLPSGTLSSRDLVCAVKLGTLLCMKQ